MTAQPFFLPAHDAATGQRFCLHHAANPAAARGTMLYVPPFAEELNQSRRMAALQARACAQAGWHVLQIDLYGCGDSSGDFSDARWQLWRDDVALASSWLRNNFPGPLTLWGLRLGALLALDCATQVRPDGLLLWQTVVSGQAHLRQFGRLQSAARLFATGPSDDSHHDDHRHDGKQENQHEIAGYTIAPALADAIRRQQASPLPPPCPVHWLELGSPRDDQPPTLQAASLLVVERWRQAGAQVTATALYDPPFWNSTEIVEAPALLAASLAALSVLAPNGAAA